MQFTDNQIKKSKMQKFKNYKMMFKAQKKLEIFNFLTQTSSANKVHKILRLKYLNK